MRYKKVKIYAYMDDISLVSSDPEELRAALALLLSEAAKINLHANLSKTFAHGPLMGACLPATAAPIGVKILGAWIAAPGNEEAEQNYIRKKRLSHNPLFDTIPQLSSETSFAILRFCAHPVWNFITRVHPDTLQESMEFDARVRSTLSKIVDVPIQDFTIVHNKLIHLPLSKGGAGLRAYELICKDNYAASLSPDGDDQETRSLRIDDKIVEELRSTSLAALCSANAKRHASAWLNGPSEDFFFPSRDFQAAIRYRLGLYEKWGARTSRVCHCKYRCDSAADFSHHILGCSKRKGINVSTRHTALKKEVAKGCQEVFLHHKVEEQFAAGDLADLIIFQPDEATPELLIDFTITSCLSKSGASEEEATKRKNRRYKEASLIVAQVDVTGGMANATCKLLNDIASFSDDQSFIFHLRESVAKTLQRFNGIILRRASPKQTFGTFAAKKSHEAMLVSADSQMTEQNTSQQEQQLFFG